MASWYYMVGSQRQGPVSDADFRVLARGASFNAQTLVWTEGMQQWTPACDIPGLLPTARSSDAAPRGEDRAAAAMRPPDRQTPPTSPGARPAGAPSGLALDERKFVDDSEGVAFALVFVAACLGALLFLVWTIASFGAVLVFAFFILLALLARHALSYGYYRANAVEVTATQFPEIYASARNFATRLGRPLPEIYVVQDSIWNALAMRLIGSRVVVLHSALVDSILLKGNERELAFIVGHELGHHYAGHLGWRHFVASWGGWCIWPRLWYSRRCEFTCDRYGLACAGSLEAAQRAVCNMAVGAQLARRVDIAQARQQWESRRGELFVRYRALYSTHPHTLDRLATLERAASELGIS